MIDNQRHWCYNFHHNTKVQEGCLILPEDKYMLHLLGAYIKNEEPCPMPEIDWHHLMRTAHIHNVLGILGYMCMTYPICSDTAIKKQLRAVCLKTIADFTMRTNAADLLTRCLSEHGIDHILMKGYILRQYYPVPELRTFGDIDLVIRPEDRQKCHNLMLEQGFSVKNDWEPVFSYTNEKEFYEIHTEILDKEISEKTKCLAYFSAPWQHTSPHNDHSLQFTTEFHFLYLIAHLAKHAAHSGAGIRMYLDITIYILRFGDTMDWEYIDSELGKIGLSDFADTVFLLISHCWGISGNHRQKTIYNDFLEDFLEFTLSGGIFGKVGRDRGTILLTQESRHQGNISKTGTLLKRTFPSAKTIQNRYTYLQTKPWLLPAAWVHRFIINSSSLQQHTEEAQKILSSDMEKVQQLRTLYEKIGL